LTLRSPVALKVLRPSLLAHPKILSRFLREARIAASLAHPSIVRVFDVGEERGLHYIVMELVEGRELREIVRTDGPLRPRSALRIARRIAEALEHAHGNGIVHRDVKPGNILVQPDGSVKLTDLGLARPTTENTDSEVTQAGEVLGTPVYMSPEQCRGDPIDGRADLYSLGATLYMVLSGEPPFRAERTATLLHKVINEMPVPLELKAPRVPEAVGALVRRLMAKHRGARFQTGRELVAAIDGILSGQVPSHEDSQRTRPAVDEDPDRIGLVRGVALCVLGTVLGIGVYLISPSEESSASSAPPAVRPTRRIAVSNSRPTVRPLQVSATSRSAATSVEPATPADPDLTQRVEQFRDLLLAGRSDALMGYFPEEIRSNPTLHVSLLAFVERLRALSPQSGRYVITPGGDDRATATFVFLGTDEQQPLGLPLEWVRHDGEWYASPRTTGAPTGE
jgi:serine/threonine protein kinase